MDAPHCPEGRAEMEAGQTVCPACGKTVVPEFTPDPVEGDPGAYYCYRHKREVTRLRCGRCGRAICTQCAMIGPAGPRCPDCGRNKVPVRGRAVWFEVSMFFRGLFRGAMYSPFRLWIAIILIGAIIGVVRGCAEMMAAPHSAPVETEQPD
jgi:hypothetical protein